VFGQIPETALTDKEYPTKKLKVKKPARPVYPRTLMGTNVEEKVQVKFVVGPDGNPLNPSVVSVKHKDFEASAIQAVALMSLRAAAEGRQAGLCRGNHHARVHQ